MISCANAETMDTNVINEKETLLTNHESNYGTKKSKYPECRSKSGNKIKQAAKETTYEHGKLPTKLV